MGASGDVWEASLRRFPALLSADDADVLFLGGCAPNQGTFYPLFDYIILLTSPTHLIVERLTTRTNNPYGSRPEDIARTRDLLPTVEPLLRRGAGHEIDTSASLDEVVTQVLRLVGERA